MHGTHIRRSSSTYLHVFGDLRLSIGASHYCHCCVQQVSYCLRIHPTYAPCLKPKTVNQVVERLPVVEGLVTITDAGCAHRQQSNQDHEGRSQRYRRSPNKTAWGCIDVSVEYFLIRPFGWIGVSDTVFPFVFGGIGVGGVVFKFVFDCRLDQRNCFIIHPVKPVLLNTLIRGHTAQQYVAKRVIRPSFYHRRKLCPPTAIESGP